VKPTTRKDLCIPQTDIFRLVVTVSGGPDDITGYTAEMQIRKTKASTVVLADLDPDWFTIDAVNRQVVLEIPAEATAVYDWTGAAMYDMHLLGTSPERWRLLEGKASLDKTVTRES
jgi:hypothetical protein